MTLFDHNSPAFLAMHLHQLRKLVTEQSDKLFEDQGLILPSSCVSIMIYLLENKRASITELSEKLHYSHQLVNQRLAILLDRALVSKTADPRDRRRSRIILTRKGVNQARKLIDLMPIAAEAFTNLFDEIGVDLVKVLAHAKQQLENKPLVNRVSVLSADKKQ